MAVSVSTLTALSLKLTRSNYNYWKPLALSTVRANALDDYLLGIVLAPEKYLPATENAQPQVNPSYLEWIKRDQLLVSWLLSSVSESMLGHISRYASAYEIWMVLEKLFQNTSKARVLQLRNKLHSFKKGDLTIDDYVAQMREIADDLSAAGQPIADDDFIMHLLEGLGPDFDVVVVNLTSRSDKFTIPDVHFALQTHESRLLNQNVALSVPMSANVAMHSSNSGEMGSSGSGYRGRGGYNGRGGGYNGRGGRGRSGKGRLFCQLCGKNNHVAYKCFRRFDHSFAGPEDKFGSVQQAHVTTAGSQSVHDNSEWFVDSGATTHITANLNNLQVKDEYCGADGVTVGNGSTLPISHVELGIHDYPVSPEVKSDIRTPVQSFGREFTTPKSKSDASTSYAAANKQSQQQSLQMPMVSSSWWSPAKTGGSAEQEDKGKGSPVEGVVHPGALITLPPPREVARPGVKKSLVPVGNLNEEEWVTVYGFFPADTNLILREFEKCGLILKHIPGPRDANWMHILYQNRSDAQKALSKNGMELNGVLIIGVKPVDPMQRKALNDKLNNQGFMTLPPAPWNRNLESNGFKVSPFPYYLQNGSSSTRQSSGTMAIPAISTVSKILDLMFVV